MAEIRVGEPDVEPDASSHIKGVAQGNAKGAYDKEVGHNDDGTADSRRSTGVNPKAHNPILPVMPNLPPG
ncbi:hypothetical protein [Actinospica robiniae]|uniref:hypothetical protein n=1 Tax=Actinospica robiniae TaxID=304901 RepID=UPI00041FF222|nr:hypothetical protein [Actinospica robiniae]